MPKNKALNKSDLVLELSTQYGLSKRKAEHIVALFFDELSSALIQGERLEFRGFGTFAVKDYEGYVGRNPSTGDSAVVPSKKRVRFRMSEIIFEEMNQEFEVDVSSKKRKSKKSPKK